MHRARADQPGRVSDFPTDNIGPYAWWRLTSKATRAKSYAHVITLEISNFLFQLLIATLKLAKLNFTFWIVANKHHARKFTISLSKFQIFSINC